MPELTDRDRAILDMSTRRARGDFSGPGPYEEAIRRELGLRPVQFFQWQNALIDDVHALAYAPITVNRLRRVRDIKRAVRDGRTPPTD